MNSRSNDSQSNAGKNVSIVSLSGYEFQPIFFICGKWRAGGEYCSSFGIVICLFSSAFGFAGGVAQCKYDGLFVKGGHPMDDFFGENTTDSSCTNQYAGFQFFDNVS